MYTTLLTLKWMLRSILLILFLHTFSWNSEKLTNFPHIRQSQPDSLLPQHGVNHPCKRISMNVNVTVNFWASHNSMYKSNHVSKILNYLTKSLYIIGGRVWYPSSTSFLSGFQYFPRISSKIWNGFKLTLILINFSCQKKNS